MDISGIIFMAQTTKLLLRFFIIQISINTFMCVESTNVNKYIKFGSFNAQNIGAKKVYNDDVVHIFSKIISRYDVVALQEIEDKSDTAIHKLLKHINENTPKSHQYLLSLSPRTGEGHAAEQFAVIYRKWLFQLQKETLYPDTENAFARDPWVIQFTTPHIENVPELTLAVVHIKPGEAVKEIQSLTSVFDWIEKAWDSKNILVMGDFNAGCSYVAKKYWSQIPLRQSSNYLWLIDDSVDTTAAASKCPYDRIVIMGESIIKSVSGLGQAFKFEEEFNLSQEMVKSISDHYPVEFDVYSKIQFEFNGTATVSDAKIVTSGSTVSKAYITGLMFFPPIAETIIKGLYGEDGVLRQVNISFQEGLLEPEFHQSVMTFHQEFPQILTHSMMNAVDQMIRDGSLRFPVSPYIVCSLLDFVNSCMLAIKQSQL